MLTKRMSQVNFILSIQILKLSLSEIGVKIYDY